MYSVSAGRMDSSQNASTVFCSFSCSIMWTSSLNLRVTFVPGGRLLVSVGGSQNQCFVEGAPRDLEPDGSVVFREAPRD